MKSSLVSTFVLLTALTACDDSAAAPDDTRLYAEFLTELRAKRCERDFRCAHRIHDEFRGFNTIEDCIASTERMALEADLQAYLAAGTVRFDAVAAAACLSSFDHLCLGEDYVIDCYRVLVGTIADGASCAEDIQCDSTACMGSNVSCGVCAPRSADGEPCVDPNNDCSTSSECRDSICAPAFDWYNDFVHTELGESCGHAGDGITNVCAPDLICGEDLVCSPRRPLGQPCTEGDDVCEYGTSCVNGLCAPIELVSLEGAACGPLDAAFGVCDRNQRLYCAGGTCQRLAGNGESGSECVREADCESALCVMRTCVAPDTRPTGALCVSDLQCATNECSGGACRERLLCNGESR